MRAAPIRTSPPADSSLRNLWIESSANRYTPVFSTVHPECRRLPRAPVLTVASGYGIERVAAPLGRRVRFERLSTGGTAGRDAEVNTAALHLGVRDLSVGRLEE